jgi:hypothetical protein
MGKKETEKKKKNNKKNKPVKEIPQVIVVPQKETKFKQAWNIFASILIVFGAIPTCNFVAEYFKSAKEKREEREFEEGYLKPLPLNLPDSTSPESTTHYISNGIQDTLAENTDTSFGKNNSYPLMKGIFIKDLIKKKSISINLGTNIYGASPSELFAGKNIGSVLGFEDMNIILGAKDDRLYISVEMSDLQRQEHIGIINFNHWVLYMPNLLNYQDDDYRLEVRDKQNNIVLAVKYNQDPDNPEVTLAGYFISPQKILILPNDRSAIRDFTYGAIEGDKWKQICLERIKRIKTIFPEKN